MGRRQDGTITSAAQVIDLPLIGQPLQRGTNSAQDQRYVNVLFERVQNPLTGGESTYVFKRPCLENFSQPPAGAATARGLYGWNATGKIYSVFANKIYSNTTDLGVTLAGTSGRVWFAETPATASEQILVISDGADNYHIQTNDTITQIDETDDAQYPVSNLGPVVFFDDYIVQAQSDGEIWNTDPDNFDAWVSTALISGAMYGDALEAITRQKDQLIAFGKFSTEFFFDNGTTPSPFLRIDSNALPIGLASKNTLAQAGDIIMWVGESPSQGIGGRQVWRMEGLNKVVQVSLPAIERVLNAEGSSISSASAWVETVAGHQIYVLNLSSADRTFVYDIGEKMWCEWSNTATAKFPGAYATSLAGVVYVQDATNGRIYKLLPTVYQDSGTNITVTIVTDNYDFNIPQLKNQTGLWITGDNTTGNLSVTESDDDYANFNTARTINLALTRKYLPQGGSFDRRAYKLTYTDNYSLRLSKLFVKIEPSDE